MREESENIMACRNWRVSGEYRGFADFIKSISMAGSAFHLLWRIFSKTAKAGWPSFIWRTEYLIPMAWRILTPPIPKTISWRKSLFQIAGVEPVGNTAVPGIIGIAGGIDEIESDFSYLNLPDFQVNGRIQGS